MKVNKIFFLIGSLFWHYYAHTQIVDDPRIVKKYTDDTLNYQSFPNTLFLDSLIINPLFNKWEINYSVGESLYKKYYNFYRYPKTTSKKPKT